MDMKEESMKNDGVEQQHKNMLENKESNMMTMAQRKVPSPSYCDVKGKVMVGGHWLL